MVVLRAKPAAACSWPLFVLFLALASIRRHCAAAFSAPSSGGNHPAQSPDDGGRSREQAFTASTPPPPQYKTRSTAAPDVASGFAAGSAERRARLHSALSDVGIDPEAALTGDSAEFRDCTAALRMYSSFVLPKSEGALATAELPQRASVIANAIAFQLREYRSHREGWLRNHDRSLAEADEEFRSRAADAGGGLDSGAPRTRYPLTLVLDNVRSAHNVGNILRLAEAARVADVILCGMTPGPPHPKVLKTAVGSAEYVPHSKRGSTIEAVRELKRRGTTVWGVETTERSKTVWRCDAPRPLALVFGNELVGVDADVLRECDELVCLPTHGVKNSLNVATCASVVVWEALRQWDEQR